MDIFKNNNMKQIYRILAIAFTGALMLCSCKEDDVDVYQVEDCAVIFESRLNNFSLRKVTEDSADLEIPVKLVGIPTDYDREFEVVTSDSTAVRGRDFDIVSHCIKAGDYKGSIVVHVTKPEPNAGVMASKFEIVPNEHFRAGIPAYSSSVVSWSDTYARPQEGVWRYWWLYMCNGYSIAYHKLLLQVCGDDMELYTCSKSYITEENGYIYKLPTWWISTNHAFREFVQEHDRLNPGDPYRHSEDYEYFSSYKLSIGEGVKSDTPPTILETLRAL